MCFFDLCRCSTIFRRCYADLYKYVSQFTLSFMYIDVPWFSLQSTQWTLVWTWQKFALLQKTCCEPRTEIRTAWYLGPGGTLAQETESSTRNAMCFDVSRHEVASVGKLVGSSLGSEEWQEFLANIFLTDKWQRIPNKCLSPV
jgi:hypothetical protein